MDGLTCNRLAVLGKPSSMGACCSGAAVPTGSHQRKESTTEAIGDRHYWVTEGYCPWFTHGYRRLAKKWREARAKIAAYDEPARSTIRGFWNDAPYPANPVYLLGMLRDIERGRIALDKPLPWRPTEEEIRIGRDSTSQGVSIIASRPGELE